MRFRFRDRQGKTVSLGDVSSLLEAIRKGEITPETLLAVGEAGDWRRADTVAAYQEAVAALARGGGGPPIRPKPSSGTLAPSSGTPAPPSGTPAPPSGTMAPLPGTLAPDLDAAPSTPPPRYLARTVRIAILAGLVMIVLILAAIRIRYLGRAHRVGGAAPAAVVQASQVRQAVAVLTVLAADSSAAAIRRVQDWVSRQRFDQRFHGEALGNPASLRAIRQASIGYRSQIDGLIERSQDFALRLMARADSAEGAEAALEGLGTAVEDALAAWERQLVAYAELERAAAAALDSAAGFLLERSGSFVVREGQPVFLSRTDAARYATLLDHFAEVANRESSWAGEVRAKRPAWMTALPEALRPGFGQPLVRAP
jgi:hypothetical protein